MSDDGYLAAIADTPADDLVRLVYADWLDERGDDRATFLRFACQAIAAARQMAKLRPNMPADWVARVDPFPHAFTTYRMPSFECGDSRTPDGNRLAVVTEVFVRTGDRVIAGQPLFAVESDGGPGNCAAWDLVASEPCVIMLVVVGAGSWVSVGMALAVILRG